MTEQQAQQVREWFTAFTNGYRERSAELGPGIVLKTDHTLRVVAEMDALTATLELNERDRRIAGIIALLHDVGRFPQIEKYGTMSDRRSENHALLGVRTIREHGVLDHLDMDDRELVLTAITNHNLFKLPENLQGRTLLFCRLIRDADKLDIWRVMISADNGSSKAAKDTVFYSMNDDGTVHSQILMDLNAHQSTKVEYLNTRNDFRMLVLGWVFDLHFHHSIHQVRERKIIETFEKKLPETDDVKQVIQSMYAYLENALENELINAAKL